MNEKKWKEIEKKIDEHIKKKNAHVTAQYKVSSKAGRKAGLEADTKLRKLFSDLEIDPTEYARRKLGLA